MGHHGWGHHDWGDFGGDWSLGWIFPAIIVGKIIGEAFENSQAQPWGGKQPSAQHPPAQQPAAPQPAQPTQPRPAAAPAGAALRCGNCGGAVYAQFAFCPHCGRRLEPPACRYCGQTLEAKAGCCTHCGAPRGGTPTVSR